jgi:hypothetical protein
MFKLCDNIFGKFALCKRTYAQISNFNRYSLIFLGLKLKTALRSEPLPKFLIMTKVIWFNFAAKKSKIAGCKRTSARFSNFNENCLTFFQFKNQKMAFFSLKINKNALCKQTSARIFDFGKIFDFSRKSLHALGFLGDIVIKQKDNVQMCF